MPTVRPGGVRDVTQPVAIADIQWCTANPGIYVWEVVLQRRNGRKVQTVVKLRER
jgi:hypothetical protein